MTEHASSRALEEYLVLRATLRERGSLRFLVASLTFSAWAGTLIAVGAYVVIPLFALAPLLVLAAGFEVVFALHVGVERIGRYLQVKYEAARELTGPLWEHTAMSSQLASGGAHALFLPVFLVAAALNWILGIGLTIGTAAPEEFSGFGTEILLFGGLHVVAIARWLTAARFARNQRARDLEALSKQLVS
jgi:hypothetical protein